MLKGYNLLGNTETAEGNIYLQVFSTVRQMNLPEKFTTATAAEVDQAVTIASKAFQIYKNVSPESKAVFLETIAAEIENIGEELIERAKLETGLTEQRLIGERGRTTSQLKLFAALLREGSWVEAVIDEAIPDRKPLPRSDLRKMNVPIGPVVVFGASNFPFAFSTAGGDTASALAAGNPVIVKAHASHLGTNELIAAAIKKAVVKTNMPDGVFSFVIGEGAVTGMQLVKHPGVKAVGFTGSFRAGMAIFKAAVNERELPIPVFAEMSSINPVLVLPSKLKQELQGLANKLAGSIALGVGQFCTNPGLLFVIEDESFDEFAKKLAESLAAIPEASMLNAGICQSYYVNRQSIASQNGVTILYMGDHGGESFKGSTALLQVDAEQFISNPALQNEIFGPASLIVKCRDESSLLHAVHALHGQLTGTILGDENDMKRFSDLINVIAEKVGRLIYNGVPTGVEVSHAMVHGGPFPATTDARSTSVGADAIKRFVRPFCYQDFPYKFLPDALKNENPLHIMRKVNAMYTKDPI
jgi:alpha-ketoglutaric semialdehyde dehydrogenase